MRNFLKPRAMLSAVTVISAISAAWVLASAPPASSRPALRGTDISEPEKPRPLPRESRPEEQIKANAAQSQQFAVICAAGCGSARDAIVSLTPRQPQQAAVSASAAQRARTANEAVCIGGCYNRGTPAVIGIAEAAPETRVPAGTVKRPLLRREEDRPTSSTSKRWYDRLGNQRAD